MKQIILILLVSFSSLVFSQNINIEIHQKNKKIKFSKNGTSIDKSSFSLVFKFKKPFQILLIAGNDSLMQNLPKTESDYIKETVLKAGFGGATGYFNESLAVKARNNDICTAIFYEDEQHHSFDSIYKKRSYIYGVRTIEKLSTPDDYLYVEGWKETSIVFAVASKKNEIIKPAAFKLDFKETYLKPIDVRGKEFIELGEATFQEGCEGCGNLGSFHFLMNGKTVDYLRSGSDMMSFGNYTQIDNQISIGNEISFTISVDGNTLFDNKYKTVYTKKVK